MPGRDIIVIGASAGGVQALMELVSGLPHDLPAAVFVVVHTSPTSPGVLPRILDRAGPLPCKHAVDGKPIRPRTILVAPPDHHLLIKRNRVIVTRGPRENGFRPAVDPLFRTAARVYGPRVVGVVLSGGLDDGTEGLALIKRRGGVALVQDPEEATFPSMPTSAVQNVDVDQVLRIAEMPAVLVQMALEPVPEAAAAGAEPMDDDMSNAGTRDGNGEVRDLAEVGDASLQTKDIDGPPSGLTCPECGGALWELGNGKLTKYRCHVGHSYTPQGLVAAQSEQLEAALWSALRALEESASLRRRMAARSRKGNWEVLTAEYEKQAEEAEQRAAVLRTILMVETSGDVETPRMALTRAERGEKLARARRRGEGRPTGEPTAPPASEKPAARVAARKARAGRASGKGASGQGSRGARGEQSRSSKNGQGANGAGGGKENAERAKRGKSGSKSSTKSAKPGKATRAAKRSPPGDSGD